MKSLDKLKANFNVRYAENGKKTLLSLYKCALGTKSNSPALSETLTNHHLVEQIVSGTSVTKIHMSCVLLITLQYHCSRLCAPLRANEKHCV